MTTAVKVITAVKKASANGVYRISARDCAQAYNWKYTDSDVTKFADILEKLTATPMVERYGTGDGFERVYRYIPTK